MKKKPILFFLAGSLALTVAAYGFRKELILTAVTYKLGTTAIAANRDVPWQSGPEDSAIEPDKRPPNLVFILADDLGINDISTFGGGVANGAVRTPNIDALAASGASFTQAYAGTASCAPSRAMLMTGRYPTRHGFEFTPTVDGMAKMVALFGNSMRDGRPEYRLNEEAMRDPPSYEAQGLPPSEVTIAEMLRERGYYTAHIGKWHLGRSASFSPNGQGFDDSLLMASGLYLPQDDANVVNAKVDFDPIDRFLWAALRYAAAFNNGEWFKPAGYLTDYWTEEAVRVIRRNKHRPFFLYLAHWGVHTPLQATRADYEAVGDIQPERQRVYAAMVRALDRSVGRVMDALDREGLLENTLVVFSSDNGGAGYIGLPGLNAPYRGWKLTLFEGGIRVPLFMSWPKVIPAGLQVQDPVGHIDVAPTLAAAAGAQLPEDRVIDGVDLLPYAAGVQQHPAPHKRLFWQSAYYRAVREGDWKLHVTRNPPAKLLYNLSSDPTEQNNVAQLHPQMLRLLETRLSEHQAAGRKPLYPWLIEGPVSIDKPLGETVNKDDLVLYWPN